jgi:hypothetical protein
MLKNEIKKKTRKKKKEKKRTSFTVYMNNERVVHA